jgi:hypothetical protein
MEWGVEGLGGRGRERLRWDVDEALSRLYKKRRG